MIAFEWDGIAMIPLRKFQTLCDNEFVVGEKYTLEAKDMRSIASHNQYFAAIKEYWLNLPESISDNHVSPEHLRKFALIKCGYYDQTSIVVGTKADAGRVAAYIRALDDFAIVTVHECEVRRYTAKSQSRKAMGGKVFQKSKADVLDYLEILVMGKAA